MNNKDTTLWISIALVIIVGAGLGMGILMVLLWGAIMWLGHLTYKRRKIGRRDCT